MPKDYFINFLETKGKIEDEDKTKIYQSLKILKANKNEIIIKKDKVCSQLFFIYKGILRTYTINEKGVEVTRLISSEDQFCGKLFSFNHTLPSKEYIQSLESSTILCIDQTDFHCILSSSENVNRIYSKMLEESQKYHIKRFEFITSYSPIEKVSIFIRKNPILANRISNKIFASYLCITPETSCRIRKKKNY